MATQIIKFTLFVAGRTLNSLQARANFKSLCDQLKLRHELEVVDIFLWPARALAAGVRLTPTLLRLSPAPQGRITGTLHDRAALADAMALNAPTAPALP